MILTYTASSEAKLTVNSHSLFLSVSFRWHRIAYSVQDKSVTLYLDCQRIETLDLLRGDNAVVSTDGVTVFGTRLLDKDVFEVGASESIGTTVFLLYHSPKSFHF